MARAMISPIKGWKAALVRRFAPRAFTKRASILTREERKGVALMQFTANASDAPVNNLSPS